MKEISQLRSYYEAAARRRMEGLLDEGSFREFLPPTENRTSPHLALFNVPPAFDDGVVIGQGSFGGKCVFAFAQEGKFLGGALGEIHGAKITGLLRRALAEKPAAVLALLDSGGVRLQEANAGEIAISEIIRAMLDVRAAGIPVIGIIGGMGGCFGGAGIISGCCSCLVVSAGARIGVSGPEVIEATAGVEAFDSRDRARVWRTTGGINRYLFGIADKIVEDDMMAFRSAAMELMKANTGHTLEAAEHELAAIEDRISRFAGCRDGRDVWQRMGIADAGNISEMRAGEIRLLRKDLGRKRP